MQRTPGELWGGVGADLVERLLCGLPVLVVGTENQRRAWCPPYLPPAPASSSPIASLTRVRCLLCRPTPSLVCEQRSP